MVLQCGATTAGSNQPSTHSISEVGEWRWGSDYADRRWKLCLCFPNSLEMRQVHRRRCLARFWHDGCAHAAGAACCAGGWERGGAGRVLLPARGSFPMQGMGLGSKGGGHWWLGKLEATGGGKGLQPCGKGQPPVPGLQVLKEWNVSEVWRSGNIL